MEKIKNIKNIDFADITVISHYHYDHFIEDKTYSGILLSKNPNEFINDSQRRRALSFFEKLFMSFGLNLKDCLEAPKDREYEDPLSKLESAKKDFGDYQKRRTP